MKTKKTTKRMINIILFALTIIITSIVSVSAAKIISSSTVTYNNAASGLNSTNVQSAVDELYMMQNKYEPCINQIGNFACYLKFLEENDTVLTDDATKDHNMRYTGKTPNNYVTFEDEEWRIIGVFNNVDNGVGKKEARVKIIKNETLGTYQWNNGTNIWKNSTLNLFLQETSYASNSMIENAVWHLGDANGGSSARKAYEEERSTNVASGNEPTWTGKVGLMYPSDYGYASTTCKNVQVLGSYNQPCNETNWLYQGNKAVWTISPFKSTTEPNKAHNIGGSGDLWRHLVTSWDYVYPTVYLKSSVICKNCFDSNAGTKSNPFQIELP